MHRRREAGWVVCGAAESSVVESEESSLFGDFGKRAIGRWTWARRVVGGVLWAIVVSRHCV